MPVEIQDLVCTVALLFVIIAIQAFVAVLQWGPMKALGNRDDVPPLTGWAARVQRCEDNQVVSLVLFAPLVLATVLLKQADHFSALGAMIYLYARLAYTASYLIGIPVLRTICWAASIVGIVYVAYSLYV
jgi:uncharacterized MAPEG superfamily protein